MGEVYRARDTRLDRDVAIKVLPPHLAMDEAARARFEREAKAIAALSHPNILAVYDVGTTDGVAFVVMELLEGETLRQRLNQSPGASAHVDSQGHADRDRDRAGACGRAREADRPSRREAREHVSSRQTAA